MRHSRQQYKFVTVKETDNDDAVTEPETDEFVEEPEIPNDPIQDMLGGCKGNIGSVLISIVMASGIVICLWRRKNEY